MDTARQSDNSIAVLGGGACGQTFAAELSLAGCEVRLFDLPQYASAMLGTVLQDRRIELFGEQRNFKWFRREGVAEIDVVTTDIAEAVDGAKIIIIAIPAKGHRAFFETLIPHLKDGQVVSIFPDNFGALILREMMRKNRCKADVIVGGWSSMPYGVRLAEPGRLDCSLRIRSIMGDAFPSADGDRFFEAVAALPIFDGALDVARGDTILGVDLSNPNPVVHVPGSILNVGAMEVSEMEGTLGIPKGQYSMYKYGMSPAVCRVQYEFYREEKKIAEALGIKMAEHAEEDFFCKAGVMGKEYRVPFVDVVLPPIAGPDSVRHRYFTEDIPVGTVVRYRLAEQLGVKAPVIESLIRIGSITCGTDFLAGGLTLGDLGLEGMSAQDILRYVRQGDR